MKVWTRLRRLALRGDADVVERVLAHLKDNYGLEGPDFVSAELALVPAMPPRDVGFDRRLIAAYGQDDKLSAFASLVAATKLKNASANGDYLPR